MKRFVATFLLAALAVVAHAQERTVQNRPYIDLRPMHFGISVGTHMQDLKICNIGPQVITDDETGERIERTYATDVDNWSPGFNVGVLAEMRLSDHFALRITPTMLFGMRHITYRNLTQLDEQGQPALLTQNLKSTYLTVPVDIKFSAERFNNYRPYLLAGVSGALNLTTKNNEYMRLKSTETFIELGIGCDFYLPFFKIIPELKFCCGLSDPISFDFLNNIRDINKKAVIQSGKKGRSNMFMLSFYFE